MGAGATESFTASSTDLCSCSGDIYVGEGRMEEVEPSYLWRWRPCNTQWLWVHSLGSLCSQLDSALGCAEPREMRKVERHTSSLPESQAIKRPSSVNLKSRQLLTKCLLRQQEPGQMAFCPHPLKSVLPSLFFLKKEARAWG